VRPFTISTRRGRSGGFSFRAEGIKVGVATDLGYLPVSVRDHLRAAIAGDGIEFTIWRCARRALPVVGKASG